MIGLKPKYVFSVTGSTQKNPVAFDNRALRPWAFTRFLNKWCQVYRTAINKYFCTQHK
jgi:hypothetical protein